MFLNQDRLTNEILIKKFGNHNQFDLVNYAIHRLQDVMVSENTGAIPDDVNPVLYILNTIEREPSSAEMACKEESCHEKLSARSG